MKGSIAIFNRKQYDLYRFKRYSQLK